MIRIVEFERRNAPPTGYITVNSTGSFISAAEAILGALRGEGVQADPVLVAVEYDSGWASAVRALIKDVDPDLVSWSSLGVRAELSQLGKSVPDWLDPALLAEKAVDLARLLRESIDLDIVDALLYCFLGNSFFLTGLAGREVEFLVLCADWDRRGNPKLSCLLSNYLERMSGAGSALAAVLRSDVVGHAKGLLAALLVRNYPADLRQKVIVTFCIKAEEVADVVITLPRPTYALYKEVLPLLAPKLAVVVEELERRSESSTKFLRCVSGVLVEELQGYTRLAATEHECDYHSAKDRFGDLPAFDQAMKALYLRLGQALRHEKYRYGMPQDLSGWAQLYRDAYVPEILDGQTDHLSGYDVAFATYLVRDYAKIVAGDPLFAPNWVRRQYQEHEERGDVLILLLLDGLEAYLGERLLVSILNMATKGEVARRFAPLDKPLTGVAAIPTVTRIASRAVVYGGPIQHFRMTTREEDLFRKHFPNGVFARVPGAEAAANALAQPADEYCLVYRTVDSLQHHRQFEARESTEAAEAILKILFHEVLESISSEPHLQCRPIRLLVVADHGKVDIDPKDLSPDVKGLMERYHLEPDHARVLAFDPSEHTAEDLQRALGDDWIVLDPSQFFLPGRELGGVGYVIPRAPLRTTTDLPRRVHAGLSLRECMVPMFALTTIAPEVKDLAVSVVAVPELTVGQVANIKLSIANPNGAVAQSVEISIPDLGVTALPAGDCAVWETSGSRKVDVPVTPARQGHFRCDVYVDFVLAGQHKRSGFKGLLELNIQSGDLGRNRLDDEFEGF